MTEPEPLQQIDRTYVLFRGRKLSYFSGCDYFRLASDPEVLKAARDGTNQFGLNVAASRLTTGNHALYRKLEKKLAEFFAAPDALLVSAGYVANLIVAQGLAGTFSHALIDERAHVSLFDAAQLLDCPVLQFKHRNVSELRRAAERCGPGARIILLTDGMFACDGSIAPLRSYLTVLPRSALMVVDDAHGAGVLGTTGKGTLEVEKVGRSRVIQTITLSKAFGTYGGAILCKSALRTTIIKRSRLFIGSTPLPLPLANATLKALSIFKARAVLTSGGGMRQKLINNLAYLRLGLLSAGVKHAQLNGPILSLQVRRNSEGAALRGALLRGGIYPPFIQYPCGPANGFFRFVISSEHSKQQLDSLVSVLSRFREGMVPES
jgi:7-keto-8-aminopelargonate synthetase-like enzyme